MLAFLTAKKSCDFSAAVAHFPLRQISGLRRRGGAKVVGDLLAGEIGSHFSRPQLAVGILLLCHLSGKVTTEVKSTQKTHVRFRDFTGVATNMCEQPTALRYFQ
jgi:hypothetical protein